MRRPAAILATLLAVCGVAYAVYELGWGSPYTLRVLSVAGIFAIAALGYSFIFGHAGALALSQGAFMGVGAYVSGILGTRYGLPFDAALPFSVAAPTLLAALVAIPVLRLQTHYFALATLIIGQIILLVATQWESVTGGANGIGGISGLSLLGLPIRNGAPTFLLVWACVAGSAVIVRLVTRGAMGARFALMRTSEPAAQAVGIDTARLRFIAFLFSAAFAGLAGSLYVHVLRVVSPDVLGFPVMVTILTIAVIGSRRRIVGAIAGAVLIVELPEWFRFLRDDYLLAYGFLLLVVVVASPDGVVMAAERFVARLWGAARHPSPCPLPQGEGRHRVVVVSPPLVGGGRGRGDGRLDVMSLTRHFGGIRALDRVSLSVAPGEIVGLIGPNGSGKTTLVNAITGIFPAQTGTVTFEGRTITHSLPHEIARAGIARIFQTAALVEDMTAVENVAVARGGSRAEAMTLLTAMGAGDDAMTLCGALPYGARRRVEIARALATRPLLILLDEPAAGLNATEQADLAGRLRKVAESGTALLVIEHNMGFLGALADRLVCLDAGRVIAEGSPDDVRADPRVIAAYLGTPIPPPSAAPAR